MNKGTLAKESNLPAKIRKYCKRRNGARSARRRNIFNRGKSIWRFHLRDDVYVAKKLREGKATAAAGTGWGFFDRFYIFLWHIGFIDMLDGVEGKGYRRKLVSITKLLLSYSTKILIGLSSLNKVTSLLFKEVSLLKLIGFTATEIKEGVCKRGKGKSLPIHKDTLGDLLSRLSEEEVEYILNSTACILAKEGFLKGSTFILDSTDLYIPRQIAGSGSKIYDKTKYDINTKRLVHYKEVRYGFKLVVLLEAKSMIIVASKFIKLNEHESKYTLELIKQAEKNIGANKIKMLLIDNAFMDGNTLWEIKKKHNIDFIVRARTNMNVAQDVRSIIKHKDTNDKDIIFARRGKNNNKIEVIGISSLTTYEQYGDKDHYKGRNRKNFSANSINAVIVLCWDGFEYKPGKEKIFITSLEITSPLSIIDCYDLRSLIENCCFRELKQGWHIKKFPQKTLNAIRAHSLLTLAIFSLNAAFQSEKGKQLTHKGIRRLRDEDMHSIHKVVIFADNYFAVFDIEELLIITRSPPEIFFRVNPNEVRRRLKLKN